MYAAKFFPDAHSIARCWVGLSIVLAAVGEACAYEADAHYGLTKWLAAKAGFSSEQSELIARGNQRVDFGSMEYMRLLFDYACLKPDLDVAEEARASHFPSDSPATAPVGSREVRAGSAAARKQAEVVLKTSPDRAGEMLLRFGIALHAFQDSWAHEGVVGAPPASLDLLGCSEMFWMASPVERGGPHSHRADVMRLEPARAVAMAKGTYELLLRYPAINGKLRVARNWSELEAPIALLLKAQTKTAMAHWFTAQGFADVAFLAGVSVADGDSKWSPPVLDRSLPLLGDVPSSQYGVPEDLRQFFLTFFNRWLLSSNPSVALGGNVRNSARLNVAIRLKLWRVRDHGAVAELLHKPGDLSPAEMRKAETLSANSSSYIQPKDLGEALLPLRGIESYVPPLVPYLIRILPTNTAGSIRSVAIAKFRHAPYDEVAVTAQRTGEGWSVVSVISVVDH